MTKYNVGDKVRVCKDTGWQDVSVGKIVTIESVIPLHDEVWYNIEEQGMSLNGDCFEPYQPKQHEPTRSMKEPDLQGTETLTEKKINEYKQRPADVAEFNKVTKPSHYTDGAIETIDFIRDKQTKEEFIGFCTGNVMKYISRWRKKGGIEDLEKAKVYLDWAIKGAGADGE